MATVAKNLDPFDVTRRRVRLAIRGRDDAQRERIACSNRLVGDWKFMLGQEPGKPERELSKASLDYLDDLRERCKRLSDVVGAELDLQPEDDSGLIATHAEKALLKVFDNLLQSEKELVASLPPLLEQCSIWPWLKAILGVKEVMAAVIISEFDIRKAKYVSSLWKYAGLDVAKDGRGRSKRKEHLVEREYVNAAGEKVIRLSVTYNPWLKTKLMGVLAPNLLKVGKWELCDAKTWNEAHESLRRIKECFERKVGGHWEVCGQTRWGRADEKDRRKTKRKQVLVSPPDSYARIYCNYRHRMNNHERYGERNDGKQEEGKDGKMHYITSAAHRYQMSLHYMIKMFLRDLYKEWRKLEGLPVYPSYQERKLGHGGDEAA